jgi:hypothetical protein
MQAKQKQVIPTLTLESIGPHEAATMLQANHSNRRMIANHVNRLAEEMLAGEWRVTGDTIKINGDRLLDGQHRLEAIVRSGVTIDTWVARGVDIDAFEMLDTGRSRAGGDVLSALGYQNVHATSASARTIWFLERKIATLDGRVTNHAIVNTVKRHGSLPAFVAEVSRVHFARTGTVIAALYWILLADSDKGDQFTDSFLHGQDLKLTSPIYVLRERVINDPILRATKTGRRRLVPMMFRAWDSWLTGKTVGHFRATRVEEGDFPWPKSSHYLV